MGYRQTLNAFALKTITKQPNIPDYHLMVGSAEEHSPLPLLVYGNAKIPQAIAENIATLNEYTNEEISEAIANNSLEVNDLNGTISMLGV